LILYVRRLRILRTDALRVIVVIDSRLLHTDYQIRQCSDCQVENRTQCPENKLRLMACGGILQVCNRRLQHPFDDATSEQVHGGLLVRAQIAQATTHTLNCGAAHSLKTLLQRNDCCRDLGFEN
jgi:hypothetical protein